MQELARALGDQVTQYVGYLGHEFPNGVIRPLMRHVWNLFGSNTVPVALADVPTPSFGILGLQEGQPVPAVFLPSTWLLQGVLEPLMAVSAMVYCGSHAVDFYNGKLGHLDDSVAKRARAYEAEFLRTVLATWPPPAGRGLNEYQQGVLADYPDGLPDDLRYTMLRTTHPDGSSYPE